MPIILCKNSHKIFTKLLNDRLIDHLPGLISKNQSGFLGGRPIRDNILLAHELVQSLNARTRGGNMIIKMEMMKAYDRVNWAFLSQMLGAFGFLDILIDLNMKTMNANHFRVLVNG